MPDSQPNYLQTNADGSVTAEFSGGVIMPLQANESFATAGGSIAWTNGPGGAKLAYSIGVKNGNSIIHGSYARSDEGVPPASQAGIVKSVNTVTNLARVIAQANQVARLILGSDRKSSFVQIGDDDSTRNIKVGFGQTRLNAITAGWNTYTGSLLIPVSAAGNNIPFYSIIPDNNATITASEIPPVWNVGLTPITGINVNIQSAIAQGGYLNTFLVSVS